MIDLVMLSLLFDGPRYGYQLKKEAGVVLGQAAIHSNIVYPLLRRFAVRHWVRKREVPGKRGQTRQLYTLTPAGRSELLRQLSTFPEKEAQRDAAFELRVALFAALDPAARERILAAREHVLLQREERLSEIVKHFKLAVFPKEVLRFRRGSVAAELQWLRHLHRLNQSRGRKGAEK